MLSVGSIGVAAAQDARQRLLSEYAPHARQIYKAYSNVTGRYVSTHYKLSGKPGTVSDNEFKSNFYNYSISGATIGIDEAGVKRKSARETAVQNLRYGFTFYQQADQPVLNRFETRSQSKSPPLFQLSLPFANPFPIGRSYLDILSAPGTHLVDDETKEVDGQRLRVVLVEFDSVEAGSSEPSPQRMEFRFAPDRRWVCVMVRIFSPAPPYALEADQVYEYSQDRDGWPTPRRAEYRACEKGQKSMRLWHSVGITEYKRLPAPLDDSEFTMSAFGFPEPEGLDNGELPAIAYDALAPRVSRPLHKRPLFPLVVLVLTAVVGLFVYWRVRRARLKSKAHARTAG